MVEWAREHKRCAIWAGMGSGKTSAMEYLIALLRLLGADSSSPWLVLGPMRVAKDTWPEDMARWEQFRDMQIVPITGNPTERLAKLKTKNVDVFTISYELAPWLVSHYGSNWPFRNVISDESDRLKGFRLNKGGARAHQLGRIAHNLTDRWINLTGTPSPNGLKDLWGQTWYLDRGARLGRTYSAFCDRWFRPTWSGYGIEPMPHSDKEIHAALADICLTVDPKDYFDLKDPIVVPLRVKLPPAARKIYKQLEKELFAELEGGEVEVFNEAALTNKCLQLANGAVYTDYPTWIAVHDEKLEALRSVMAESGGTPLLVAYSFKSDVARIKTAFPQAVEINKPEGMRAFRAGDAPMGLAHPKSMGHGIDGLQEVTNILVRYGHGWNLGERMQMLERIGPMRQLQAGLDRPVWVYDITAEDTIDETVIESHANKWTVQQALLTAMKRKK
jgi:hypothetical protein